MSPHTFAGHAKSKGHVRALEALAAANIKPEDAACKRGIEAIATGISVGVPRIDKFRLAATVVGRRDSFREAQPQWPCVTWRSWE